MRIINKLSLIGLVAAIQIVGMAETAHNQKNVVVFSGDTVLPQIVDGAGWKTSIILANLDSRAASFTLYFFQDSGNDLILSIVGLGPQRAIQGVIPIGGSLTIETEGVATSLSQGWASMQRNNNVIGGMAVFRQRVPGRPDFEAVVPVVNQFSSRFILPVDNLNGFVTSMAIANPSNAIISIPIQLRDEQGNVLQNTFITLQPFAHEAFSVPASFPALSGRRGVLEFRTSGFGVAALGLRFSPGGAFTSFHVLENLAWIIP